MKLLIISLFLFHIIFIPDVFGQNKKAIDTTDQKKSNKEKPKIIGKPEKESKVESDTGKKSVENQNKDSKKTSEKKDSIKTSQNKKEAYKSSKNQKIKNLKSEIDNLEKDINNLKSNMINIQTNLRKGHKRYKSGLWLTIGGYIGLFFGASLINNNSQGAGSGLLISGLISTITGPILMIDSHKFEKRAGKPQQQY